MSLSDDFYGNAPRTWLIAGAIGAGTYCLVAIIRHLIVSRLSVVAARTKTEVDDAVVALAAKTRWYFFATVALSAALAWLELPEHVDTVIHRATIVVVLLQIGLWIAALVEFLAGRTLRQRSADGDGLGVATVQALAVTAKIFAWVILALVAISWAFGKPITPLITGLGIGGIALALAVQQILGDILAAVAIVFDRPFDVGDTISVDKTTGTVERIGLKTTRMRSVEGEQVIFSNADLLRSRVHNFARIAERRVLLTFEVNAKTSPDALGEIPRTVERIVTSRPAVRFQRCHLTQITEGIRRFECVYYVLDGDYNRMMDVQQAVNLDILRELGTQEIELASPMRLVERGTT